MRYCAPNGIPLSVFLRWDPLDQAAALSWQAHEGQRCRSCGTHPDDWETDRLAFHAEIRQCPGCVETERTSEQLGDDDHERGLHVHLAHGAAGACSSCSPPD